MTNCRYCGHPGAYDTGFSIECPSPKCEHFSKEQRRIYQKWNKTNKLLEEYCKENPTTEEISDEEATDPDITPVYHWGLGMPWVDLGED